jgi:hypothetical protein
MRQRRAAAEHGFSLLGKKKPAMRANHQFKIDAQVVDFNCVQLVGFV